MRISSRWAIAALLIVTGAPVASATEINIRDFGAKPNDGVDDTAAVVAALAACGRSGGGTVLVPAGTFLIARRKNEAPMLEIPSNTTLRGEGTASTLKFAARVNETNFWYMIGAAPGTTRNVTVRDLHLDGSTTDTQYVKGRTHEHNCGLFFSAATGLIENLSVSNLLVENFSGDCVAVGQGCRNVTVRDVKVRNFIRQGIQLGGGNGARDYLVTGCQDLTPSVQPGGSSIHVEHARGLTNVTITGNHCRNSILAGGVDGLIVRDNIVTGRIIGNGNRNEIVQGNIVRGTPTEKGPLLQFGYADGLIVRDNLLIATQTGQSGIYVWGTSRYNPIPSAHVSITGNLLRAGDPKLAIGVGVTLDGVEDAVVHGNLLSGAKTVTRRVKHVLAE